MSDERAIAEALQAVLASTRGAPEVATDHLVRAREIVRSRARRDRQLVEIAGAFVADDLQRASGLAVEHCRDFPDDQRLVEALNPAQWPESRGW